MSVTGADGRVDDPGWPQIASVQTGFYGGAQRCFRICCSPLKSPAVVIDYRCFEKAVPNLVWLSLILGILRQSQEGIGNGLQHSFIFRPMSVTQLCVCVYTCRCVCVCVQAQAKERRREKKNIERTMRSLSASLVAYRSYENFSAF